MPLGARWAHTLAVVEQAQPLRRQFTEVDADRLIAAAYLHDVGYAPDLVSTAFHPLDGARWLTGQVEAQVVSLVAHHSCARAEAELRGLGPQLAHFAYPERTLLDALTFCDMTSSPAGRRVSVQDRLSEIRQRYGPEHVVTKAINASGPSLIEAVRRTTQGLLATPDS